MHVGLWTVGLPEWIGNITDKGKYGVQLFFLLSAFTLFFSMSHRKGKGDSKTNFFIRRFFRIAPLFYLALIIYSLEKIGLAMAGLAEPYSFTIGNVIGTLSFIGNGFNPVWINSLVPGGWSITVEMTFYLIVPYLFSKLKNLKQALILTTVSVPITVSLNYFLSGIETPYSENVWQNFLYYWFPNQLPVFLLGILVFFIYKEGVLNKIKQKSLVSTSTLIAAPVVMFALAFIGNDFAQLHLIYAILFALIMMALEIQNNSLVVNKITTYLGEISFSIYLTHFLIIDVVRFGLRALNIEVLLSSTSYFMVLLLVTTIITVAVSHLTYKYIETPGNKLGKVLINALEKRESLNIKKADSTSS